MRIDTIISVGGSTADRKKRNRSNVVALPEKRPSWLRRHAFWLGLAVFAVAAIVAVHYLPGSGASRPPIAAGRATPAPEPNPPTAQKAFTLDKLLAMTPEQLTDVDIAEMNLLCGTRTVPKNGANEERRTKNGAQERCLSPLGAGCPGQSVG
ncbi:MAG: hypothetical protein ABIF82_10465 [Planctomycetota bacterium]